MQGMATEQWQLSLQPWTYLVIGHDCCAGASGSVAMVPWCNMDGQHLRCSCELQGCKAHDHRAAPSDFAMIIAL
eukprot:1145005-Pelagomonas_calceolata.AAC.3